MSISKLNPYVMLNGTAEKAIKLYESALGARVEDLQRFGEAPGMTFPPELRERVMHAMLNVGGGVIMISDSMPGQPSPATGNVHVVLHFEDVEEMKVKFDALAAGGAVTMPVQDAFWGATFGMLTDAYGVGWMFNCEKRS
jgi:PhnB protein